MQCDVQIGEQITLEKFRLTPTQCRELGIDSLMLLPNGSEACGTHACVFNTSDRDWLVKITDDEEDVYGFLKSQGSPHVVGFRGAYKLRGQKTWDKRPLFAMRVEKVEQVRGNDRAYLTGVLYERLTSPALKGFKGESRYSVPKNIRDSVIPECDSYVRDLGEDPAAHRPRCSAVVNEGLDAIEDLMNRGVAFTDTHAGNWGRRRGKLVAIDLGLSRPPWSREKLKVPVLSGNRQWPPWRR